LEPQLVWAEGILQLMRKTPVKVQQWVTPERLQEKLGWLSGFSDAIAEWSEWQQVVNISVKFVNRNGVYRRVGKALRKKLPHKFTYCSSATLAKELVRFVATQGRKAKPRERFPGSTEVLESCFGKMKQLEKQQAKGGFTSLILSFGSLLAKTTTEVVSSALAHSGTRHVWSWCAEHLGTTLLAQRKIAFAESATKTG
jgi:hypothetical protein